MTGPEHRPRSSSTGPVRADGPPVPGACVACRRALSSLRLPGVFRLAHVIALGAVAAAQDGGAVGADLDTVELAFVVGLDRAGVGDDGPSRWRDVGWLLRDLEDWGLLGLTRGPTSGVDGVLLTERAREVLTRLCPPR